MKIASWNVNSLNVRLPHLEQWLATSSPDIVALQETKLEDEKFPDDPLLAMGYRSVFAGQKSYNGVAVLSRERATDVQIGVPGLEDEQKRVLAATVGDLRIVNLYVVNGQSVGSDKYAYKLRWLEAVHDWLAQELVTHPRMIVLGDFNIAPDDRDVHDPAVWNDGHILTSRAERDALERLYALGLHDSYRALNPDATQFSWWDYRMGGFRRNLGLRIDLTLVSEALRPHAVASDIDREPRTWDRPSDHAPAWVELG
ncbi:exodeoxyribonuclease III [Lysobacter auxotrophicus]|uniref:Exodeoxyribonuclease III n=1 Tax=Lysobacter auxotrophicus TaxID=2992573 RepID=A0ABN6UFD1_9GAMM|nr:exodeoxyribonuclease III [Lysobacter auxotrophicus]BDU15040.1 exodeoxyribonuclease III [Lysobacter auxotrophicus]